MQLVSIKMIPANNIQSAQNPPQLTTKPRTIIPVQSFSRGCMEASQTLNESELGIRQTKMDTHINTRATKDKRSFILSAMYSPYGKPA